MNTDFYRREIDAINEKWRAIQNASDRKGESLAIDYRLHIHPVLWEGVKKYIGNLGAEPREPMIYPEVEFLELTIVCDVSVEGWHILPAPVLPMIRF